MMDLDHPKSRYCGNQLCCWGGYGEREQPYEQSSSPLTARQAEVLRMLDHGLTAPQIARILNLSTGAVKGRISRARRILQELEQ